MMLLYFQVVVRLERSTQGNVWDVGETNRTRGKYIFKPVQRAIEHYIQFISFSLSRRHFMLE